MFPLELMNKICKNYKDCTIIRRDVNAEGVGFCVCILPDSEKPEDIGMCWFSHEETTREKYTISEAAAVGGNLVYAASIAILPKDKRS